MQNLMKNNKNKIVFIVLIGILILLICFAFYTKSKKKVQSSEPMEDSYIEIETPYLTLQFPEKDSETLVYEEEQEGDVVSEIFYMKTEGDDLLLYRFDFGDENAGEWLGMIKTDEKEIPVTYTVFVASDEELEKLGQQEETYTELMNDFNVLMNSIRTDSRFSSEKEIDLGKDIEHKLTYWSLKLPEKITCSEDISDENYRADFYTEIKGEQVNLYSVYIGEQQGTTILGEYKIDGVKKTISIESYDLDEEKWSDEELREAYQMMDTINSVIETITKSKQFSDIEIIE